VKRWIITLFVGGLLALALFGVAAAGQLEDGQAAYQRGDYEAAIRLLRPVADQGNAEAQFGLGAMYVHGLGAPKDYAQAVAW
jgi:TPR repeat protein